MNNGRLVVLGVDPGTKLTGLAVLEERGHADLMLTRAQFTSARGKQESLLDRFAAVLDVVMCLTQEHGADAVVLETQVSMRGQARINESMFWMIALGALRGFAALGSEPVLLQCNPASLKLWVAGSGRASTPQVVAAAGARWPGCGAGQGPDAVMAYCLAQMGLALFRQERPPLKLIE